MGNKFCQACQCLTPHGPRGNCRTCTNNRQNAKRRTVEGKEAQAKYNANWVSKPGNREYHNELTAKWKSTVRGTAVSLFQRARRRARDNGLPFSLSLPHIQSIVEAGVCEISGIPFELSKRRDICNPSIDQIHAGEGYTPQNTRVVLWGLNVAFHTWGLRPILEIFRRLLEQEAL
jgi:hypothetical protein